MEFHEIANVFPLLDGRALEDLTDDIRRYGQVATILLYEGKILDGRNRWRACQTLGIVPRTSEFEGDFAAAVRMVISLNLHRRHMTNAQLAEAAASMASLRVGSNQHAGKEGLPIGRPSPPLSISEAAGLLGVPVRAVGRAAVIRDHGVPTLKAAVHSGTVVPSTGAAIARAIPAIQSTLVDLKVTASEARTVAALPVEVQLAIMDAPEPVEAVREAARPHVVNNSGNNEWYTPPDIIERARRAMGGIDLDPASSDVAQRTVQAGRYRTAEDNGLACEWKGNIFLNPPYSSDLIGQFCHHLVREYVAGRMKSACVLVNNATETGWWEKLSEVATAVCLINRRVRFLDVTGKPTGAPLQGQAVLFVGEDTESFEREFKPLGRVWR